MKTRNIVGSKWYASGGKAGLRESTTSLGEKMRNRAYITPPTANRITLNRVGHDVVQGKKPAV